MKPKLAIIAIAACMTIGCAQLQNRVISDTTTTAPDGTVSKTHVEATNSDAALAAGNNLIGIGASLVATKIRADK